MTNILLLPKFASGAFTIANNSDWLDSILFTAPLSPPAAIPLLGTLTLSSPNVTNVNPNTIGLIPGQPISQSPGIPAGTFIGTIESSSEFSMVNSGGSPVEATISDAEAGLTVQPLPLDITGIEFEAYLRSEAGGTDVYLAMTTSSSGNLVNGGTTGILSFNVPEAALAKISAGTYVMDIVAIADGHTINLFPVAPAGVTVIEGVTTP